MTTEQEKELVKIYKEGGKLGVKAFRELDQIYRAAMMQEALQFLPPPKMSRAQVVQHMASLLPVIFLDYNPEKSSVWAWVMTNLRNYIIDTTKNHGANTLESKNDTTEQLTTLELKVIQEYVVAQQSMAKVALQNHMSTTKVREIMSKWEQIKLNPSKWEQIKLNSSNTMVIDMTKNHGAPMPWTQPEKLYILESCYTFFRSSIIDQRFLGVFDSVDKAVRWIRANPNYLNCLEEESVNWIVYHAIKNDPETFVDEKYFFNAAGENILTLPYQEYFVGLVYEENLQ
jgi:hypothetical protein